MRFFQPFLYFLCLSGIVLVTHTAFFLLKDENVFFFKKATTTTKKQKKTHNTTQHPTFAKTKTQIVPFLFTVLQKT